VQQRLDELAVPYTGCDAESSRIAFDKHLTKLRCVAAGVPTPRHSLVESSDASWPMGWNPPVVLETGTPGFKRGLAICGTGSRLEPGINRSFSVR
jgi:D-alanine-D-alanine ligase